MAKKSPASIEVGTELCTRLDSVKGVLDLAYEAVFANSGTNPELDAAWLALDLARQELDRIADEVGGRVDLKAPRLMLVPRSEVANG
jgi:hypothetical protein